MYFTDECDIHWGRNPLLPTAHVGQCPVGDCLQLDSHGRIADELERIWEEAVPYNRGTVLIFIPTSTVALRVAEGDEKGTQCLGV
jgi:hypothetical protein